MNVFDASRLPGWSRTPLISLVRAYHRIQSAILVQAGKANIRYRDYQRTRPLGMRPVICYAPYRSLFFGTTGQVVACCLNRTHVLGQYPQQTIRGIWKGERIRELRAALQRSDLSSGCLQCRLRMEGGNFGAVEAQVYDIIPSRKRYPAMMEFELSTQCNLKCIMCSPEFSSSLRSKDDPDPAGSICDDAFVEQLEEFIPHLYKAKFLGGEPFLISIYYKIWEKIIRKNPACMLLVQTNASVMNEKIKDLLSRGNFRISVSLESFRKETYEKIRRGGDFEKMVENLNFFAEYAKQNRHAWGISVCPMQQNWKEIPEIIENCNRLGAWVNFNVVWNPDDCSLRSLGQAELEGVTATLAACRLPEKTETERKNKYQYECLIRQLRSWNKERSGKQEFRTRLQARWEELGPGIGKMTPAQMIDTIMVKMKAYIKTACSRPERAEKMRSVESKLKIIAAEFHDDPRLLQLLFILSEIPAEKLLNDFEKSTEDIRLKVERTISKFIEKKA